MAAYDIDMLTSSFKLLAFASFKLQEARRHKK
jgi:hypothetical protein